MDIAVTSGSHLPRAQQMKSKEDVAEVARQFEATFLSSMVNTMLETVPEGSFGGGQAEQQWKSFLGNAIADQMAEAGQTGIAKSVETQLRAYQKGSE